MSLPDFATPHKYHAFLSYHTPDQRQVEVINAALERAGLHTFFAPVSLRGSLRLNKQLAAAFDNSTCLVLFIGPKGIGRYQSDEADYAAERHRPIVIVVLRDGDLKKVGRWPNIRTLDCNDPNTEFELIDHLIEDITGTALARVPLQFQSNQKTELAYPKDLDRTGFMPRVLQVHVLNTVDPARRLFLNWATLGELINNLRVQLETFQGFRAEAFFGINATGLAVAQFLNDHRKPTGLVFLEGVIGAREIVREKCLFPELTELAQSRILMVDGELKSGSGMDTAIGALRENYPKANIFYAVLAARTARAVADRGFESLEAWPVLRQHLQEGSIKGFFIASTFNEPGFYRPYRIR